MAREAGPDLLRIACFLGIVALHANGRGVFAATPALEYLIDEASRFAVPCFFLLSGYFWKADQMRFPELPLRVGRRVGPAFLFWFAVYTVLGAAGFMGSALVERSPARLFFAIWSGGAAYHLWFLPALVVGAGVVALLLRWGLRVAVASVLLLYLLGVVLGAYSPWILGAGLPISLYRNGVLFAPIFLLAGALLRRYRDPVPAGVAALLALAGLVLHVAEGWWVTGSFPSGHDYSLGTVPLAIGVAGVAIRWRQPNGFISTLGELTFPAFLMHALVLQLLVNARLAIAPPLFVVLTFTASLLLAFAAGLILDQLRSIRAQQARR